MAKQKQTDLISKVRTRVAPSPTGFPHVGTALQALFDWVYARRYQGQFVLRVEDTDQKREVPGAEQALYEALDWLGLTPDESPRQGGPKGPYRQSERLEIYQQYAQQLIDQGQAYYCFCSSERLKKVREEQQRRKQPPMYDQHCRHLAAEEVQRHLDNGDPYVIRLKVPSDQKIIVNDVLRGEVEFDSNTVDDQVLLKSDGFPTYHLAVVIDDHLMEITHIERGEEWLPSAPKHILLYQYFGWQVPQLIHTPTLRNPDKSKLSKRKGNTALWWYREQGYLPTALCNFLGLLVWKPREGVELFDKQDMIAAFEWEEMNVTGPIFDVNKLNWLNGKYLRQMSLEDMITAINAWAKWVKKRGENEKLVGNAVELLLWQKDNPPLFKRALELGAERAKILSDIPDLIRFYFQDQLEYDQHDLLQGHEPQQIKAVLAAVMQRLVQLEPYNADSWEQTIRATADEFELSHKDLFMSLRSAVTAQKFTPPLFEVMSALGLEDSSNRIQQAINFLE